MNTIVHRAWPRWAVAAVGALVALHAMPTQADGNSGTPSVPLLPKYRQECAACHLAYPPGMLPAPSWQRLMNKLPQHFGTDASLDAASVQEIAAWLQIHADGGRAAKRDAAAPPQDRITRSAWFVREHREVDAAVWKRPSVKSPSHCAACHVRADQGDFNERHVRIPR